MKSSAIDTWARAHGARLGEAAGWQVIEQFGEVEAEVAAARERVALADASAMGKVQVEGEGAAEVVWAALGVADSSRQDGALGMTGSGGAVAGQGWRGEAGEAYCIRPDLFLVLTPPGGEGEVVARLEAARGTDSSRQDRALGMTNLREAQSLGVTSTGGTVGLVTVTDMTHGWAALSVMGPRSRDVLGRLCALDLADEAFPNQSVWATSVAKTRQVIVRRDVGGVPAYTLVGARSLAGYLWEALIETARAWGGAPIGARAVEALATGTEARD